MPGVQFLYGDELAPLITLVKESRESGKKVLVLLPSFISIENCHNALLDYLQTVDNVVFSTFDDLALEVIKSGSGTFVDLLDSKIEEEAVSRCLRDSELYSEGLRRTPQFVSYVTGVLGELRRNADAVTTDECSLPKVFDDSSILDDLTEFEQRTFKQRVAESKELIAKQWKALQPVFKRKYYTRELAVAEATRQLESDKDSGMRDIEKIYVAYLFHIDEVLSRFIKALINSRETFIWVGQREREHDLSERLSTGPTKKVTTSKSPSALEDPVACPDHRREVLAVARDAYRQITEGKLKPSEMLAVARDAGQYEEVFYEVMKEFGIPVEVQTKQYFHVLAAAHFYRSLLEFATTDGRAMGEAAIEVLETGYPGVSGYSMFWMRRLIHRLGMSLDSVLTELKARKPTETLGGWTIEWWVKVVSGLFVIKDELKKATSSEEILEILVDAEAKLGIVEYASRRLKDHEAREIPRGIRAKELEGTLKLLRRLWKVKELNELTTDVLGSEKVTLDQFKATFDEFLAAEIYGTSRQSKNVLQLIDAGNIDFRHPKRLYLLGMSEGVFPSKVKESAFLGDSVSKRLTEAGLCYVQNTITSLNYERWIFTNCLAAATDSVRLSYSYLDSDGHPRLYSPFLLSEANLELSKMDQVIEERVKVDSFAPEPSQTTAKRDALRSLAVTIGKETAGIEKAELKFAGGDVKRDFELLRARSGRLLKPPPSAVLDPGSGDNLKLDIDSLNEYEACQFRYYSRYLLQLQPRDFVLNLRLKRFYWEILETLLPKLPDLNPVKLQSEITTELQNRIKSDDVPNPRLLGRVSRIVYGYLSAEKIRYQSARFTMDSRKVEFGRRIEYTVDGISFTGTLDRVDNLHDNLVTVYEIRESAEDIDRSFPSLEQYSEEPLSDFRLPLVMEALRQEGKKVVAFEFQSLRAPRRGRARYRGAVVNEYASGLAATDTSTPLKEADFQNRSTAWLKSAMTLAKEIRIATNFRVDPGPIGLCDSCAFGSLCLGPGGIPI